MSTALTDAMVDHAVTAARRRNERVVIEAALPTASPRDLDVLRAMAQDDGPSTAGDIGARSDEVTSSPVMKPLFSLASE